MAKDFNKQLREKMNSIVGCRNVFAEYEKRYCYSFDATNISDGVKICDIVVFPENTNQVSEIMKYAYEKEIPVVARGAGTNLVGACTPLNAGILLDFAKMNKIIQINKDNLTAIVEPGVIVADLQKAVDKEGLFYPPDPSNNAVSTIGGSIGLSSGGPHSFKYGTTKDYIVDLTVVLSDGRILTTGSSCVKNVTGYNLTQLFVGSEGTLGIITRATVKLIAKPEAKRVMLVYFDNLEDTAKTVNDIIAGLITPSVTDLMDKNTLRTIETFMPSGLLTDKEAALLIEIDGFQSSINEQYEKIIEVCRNNNAAHIRRAETEEEVQKIWIARRSSFAAMAKLAPDVVADDFVVPRNNIIKLVEGIRKICDKYKLTTGIMGHIGDGNIHPNTALDLRDEDNLKRYKSAREEQIELTLKLGGMLSGEHGIGCEKAHYLAKNLSKEEIDIMRAVKNLFDKKNILNPGKIFE